MPKSHRIHNITRDVWPKYSQALNAVDCCACAWVVEGVSIRDLTLAESIAARNEQARTREEMPRAENKGLIYKPCPDGAVATREGHGTVRAANWFMEQGVPVLTLDELTGRYINPFIHAAVASDGKC